jgi:hypothetical protein
MNGRVLPHHEDRDADSTRCDVCHGAGTIPEAEFAAWMQDPAFVRDLAEYTPHNYSDFYARTYERYRETEALAGRVATLTLAAFVAARRAEQGAPPIDARYVRAAQPSAEFRVRCLAACFDGTTSAYHDQDASYPCAMCAPFGGNGTMPGATVAEWMRDAGYRAYCARTFSSERVSYPRWSAQAAARDARDATREAQRQDAQRAAEAAEAAEARTAQRRRSSGAESWASWSALTSQEPRPAPRATPPSASGASGAGETEALCVICYEREQTHLFNMCGHLGFCGPCAAMRSECPICRTPGRAIKVFRVTSFGKRAKRARSAR